MILKPDRAWKEMKGGAEADDLKSSSKACSMTQEMEISARTFTARQYKIEQGRARNVGVEKV